MLNFDRQGAEIKMNYTMGFRIETARLGWKKFMVLDCPICVYEFLIEGAG
jgi:hypothetical protein